MKLSAIKSFFLGIIFVSLLSVIQNSIFLPVDILHLFPSFTLNNFISPKNSLLADPVYQFEPWRNFAKKSILSGQFPFWNPLNSQGSPFFANPQTAVLFPLNFLYYFLPIRISLFLIPLLKIYFFGFFAYLYLRSIKISFFVSIFSSFVLSTSGYFILWLLWPHTNVFLFFPLLLYFVERLTNEKRALHRHYVGIAFTYFLSITGGHPETLFICTTLFSFYAIFRLREKRKKLISLFISVIAGLGLGSILIIPFLEYLLNSFALQLRTTTHIYNFLPVTSFVVNFIPFLLGAPQFPFYRSFSTTTNFQEYASGYVGIIVFLVAVFGILKFKGNELLKFWLITVIVSWFIIYGIFPFDFIRYIPFLHSIDNNRFISLSSFGLIVLFALSFENLTNIYVPPFLFSKKIIATLFFGVLFFGISSIFILKLPIFSSPKLMAFGYFLVNHVFFILITSFLFLEVYLFLAKRKILKSFWKYCLFIPILFQTTILFLNYNPVLPTNEYYPKIQLVQKLQKLPKGTYLEVGNPVIPANINLIYGLDNAENDDAIQVYSYQKAFNNAFPIRNQWKMVDVVKKENLIQFGIMYVLSDYNLNYTSQPIQPIHTNIIGPLEPAHKLTLKFVANNELLREIRILPADYNRRNSCLVNLRLQESLTSRELFLQKIPCNLLLDNMYFTTDVNAHLEAGKSYLLSITTANTSTNNAIGLWGNSQNQPYVTLFYDHNNQDYQFLGNKGNVKIWKVSETQNLSIPRYTLLQDNPTEQEFTFALNENRNFQIKKTYFPGWRATLDGQPLQIKNLDPFIGINLPKGYHVVKIYYFPFSFLLGLIISCITGLLLLIYLVRNEKNEVWTKNYILKWASFAKTRNRIPFWKHVSIIVVGIILSTVLYLILMKTLNLHFTPPQTLTVNWLTVHNYPRKQDYFYFISFIIYCSIFSLIVWFIWILKHKK